MRLFDQPSHANLSPRTFYINNGVTNIKGQMGRQKDFLNNLLDSLKFSSDCYWKVQIPQRCTYLLWEYPTIGIECVIQSA
ncbi:hypothetical protein RRG08_028563 [Elysia crispata]|uniref:Uncharacterized protein n=1 Tax=Elysia crispata TaxID=231223 RepID=A0AAE0Y9J7_9GAST|nr:hypothetical protein RRG08_028563 [Elysia crispata]